MRVTTVVLTYYAFGHRSKVYKILTQGSRSDAISPYGNRANRPCFICVRDTCNFHQWLAVYKFLSSESRYLYLTRQQIILCFEVRTMLVHENVLSKCFLDHVMFAIAK